MKICYIAHPISGDIKRNLDKIKDIIREINLTKPDVIPFAHYWIDCHALDDTIPEERQRGIENDHEFLRRGFVDEIWLYGDKISKGMEAEIELAQSLSIPIRPMTSKTAYEFSLLFTSQISNNS